MSRLPYIKRMTDVLNRFLPGCMVLCYHRVGDETQDHWGNVVAVENFRKHVEMLRRDYRVISLSELFQAIATGKFPAGKTAVITFDDGYACNLPYACSVLDDLRAPATFYLTTYTLSSGRFFWWDELQSLCVDNPRLPERVIFGGFELPYQTEKQRAHSFLVIHRMLKGLKPQRRAEALDALARTLGLALNENLPGRRPLNENEIKQMAANPLFEIGSHSHSHCALALLNPEEQEFEIEENKRLLETLIEKPLAHFSYPFGGEGDFDEDTIRIVSARGFKSAVTTNRTAVRNSGDLYRIPRMSVKNWDAQKLRRNIEALWRQ
jgi:peptidoglycan/xylan/chitin deacetylase (PgdA/CDA1 family)